MASAEPLWRAIAVYRFASIGYALAATAPGESTAPPERTGAAGPPPADVGVEVALLDRDGVIVSVNGEADA